ncbi:Gtb1p NDAI_0C04900 [Naumovozyma dairenensis CBS 421]|uniref:Glucosidase 2 subunit beta n=1 Tax=Naumovozyma dairenensis (strain ATCC 10597 / BCRC 20456 / CBS 421 / NBRC 0211 / NRRL Y-12639) TaxID=1071378 RepID=G0W8N8_NAUDC|nr:hypothetical protein NDAI_0C04900 [Naumovozyma dairenensis CBS 421]CCD24149.1 hypothetical protein NDAI_0C04900 [Naumovozyma dairenensis CBS 421]
MKLSPTSSFLTISLILSVVIVKGTKILGISPNLEKLYENNRVISTNKWKCLNNPEIEINWDQINDNICDCPDGSDEPGTFACNLESSSSSSLFYCENDGFIPRFISKSKVMDGVCDCCDCSDEALLPSSIPLSKTSICPDLKDEFDKLLSIELENYSNSKDKLLKLFKKYDMDFTSLDQTKDMGNQNGNENGLLEKEKLIAELNKLEADSIRHNNLLSQEKENYLNKLQLNNPILYDFEQKINSKLLIELTNSTMIQIIQVSSAFNDIMKILDELTLSYSNSMNDRVVNNNVDKYFDLSRSIQMNKINANPESDEDLRVQFLKYFEDELPNLIEFKKIENDVKYNVNKAAFVKGLIRGKAEYTETLFNLINQFSEIMIDITENYNVNFQDQGVKIAVDSFKNYLTKYESTLGLKRIEMPKNLEDEFDKLINFLEKALPVLFHSNNDDDDDKNNEANEYSHLLNNGDANNGQIVDTSDLLSLKKQIKSHEKKIMKLQANTLKKKELLAKLEQRLIRSTMHEEKEKEKEMNAMDQTLLDILNDLMIKIGSDKIIDTVLDNYKYEVTINPKLPGSIFQSEMKNDKNVVKIGELQSVKLDKKLNLQKYIEHLKIVYPESSLISHLMNETTTKKGDLEIDYLFGNLPDINNGLVLEYGNGQQCWNGPKRSASLFIKCGTEFELHNVYEATKCRYVFDASGPIGCYPNFEYSP